MAIYNGNGDIAMTDFTIRPIGIQDKDLVRDFMRDHWGAEFIIVHGGEYPRPNSRASSPNPERPKPG